MPEYMECNVRHVGCFGITFGFAVEPCEVVPDLRVDGLDGAGERLGLEEQFRGDDFAIHLPLIGGDGEGLEMGYPCPEPLERFVATTAHFHGKDASRGARHSNP